MNIIKKLSLFKGSFFYYKTSALNTGKTKFVRLSVSIYFLLCGMIFSSWAARIPAIKDYFHLNEAELGAVLFMLPFGSIVALPFAGWSVHRFGSKIITGLSAISYALVLFSVSICTSVFQLSVLLFLFGFFGDALNISMNTQGLSVQKILNKPILSSLHAMWSIGALAGAVVGGWSLRNALSTQQHFAIVAVICLVLILTLYYFMISDVVADGDGQKLFAWPDKALLLLGMICFCTTLAEGAMADWSSLYYRQVLTDFSKVSTTGYTAFTFAMALGRLIGDQLIERFGYRKMLMLNGFLIALGLTLALAWQVPLIVIAGFALVGLGVSSVIPIVYMVAGKSKTMAPSAALAAVSTIGFTGFLFGPPIIGFVAHETGLRLALTIVVFLGIAIFVLSAKGIRSGT